MSTCKARVILKRRTDNPAIFPAHSKFPFHADGNSYRGDRDAEPRVQVIGPAFNPETDEFVGIIVHFSGDDYTRDIPRSAINTVLINGMTPNQALAVGRLVEGGNLGLP